MSFITQLSRQARKPFERSISERKYDEHRPSEEFYKGQEILRKENNCYQGIFVLIIAYH